VFAAMFASGMKEAECGQVRIEDVDPVVFLPQIPLYRDVRAIGHTQGALHRGFLK